MAGNELLFFIDDAIDISSAFKPERVHLPVLSMVIGVERHHRAVCLFIRVKQYGGSQQVVKVVWVHGHMQFPAPVLRLARGRGILALALIDDACARPVNARRWEYIAFVYFFA